MIIPMDTVAFARGVPAPEMLPVDHLKTAAQKAFSVDPIKLLSYGTGAGWQPLRERLAAQYGVSPGRVVITTGSLHGFALLMDIIAKRAKDEGRSARVIVESPTYDRPLLLLRQAGIEIIPVQSGANGVNVRALDQAMQAGADCVYLIPTFQNPNGATLDEDNRQKVLELSLRYGIPILEDDPYGLLHFDEKPPASIRELSNNSELIWYASSCSKTVAPGLRVGWFILPESLATAVATRANDTYISASFLGQATLDAYLDSPAFDAGVDEIRRQLSARSKLMTAALADHLPDASFVEPAGGYFLWLTFPGHLDGDKVAAKASKLGVSFVPGASFGSDCANCARLAFSSPPVELIEEGIKRLAQACNHLR